MPRLAAGRITRGSRDSGFVTIVVLMVAGLLATLVAATMHVARPSFGQAIYNADEAQAEGLIEAGMNIAGYVLFSSKKSGNALHNKVVPFKTGAVKFSVKSEGGRIDLNGADAKMLAGLYLILGGTSMSPEAFAQRILDWRDQDNKARPNGGAEAQDYRGFSLDYGPANGPFRSVGDLRFIPEVTESDAILLEPYITVFNPEGLLEPLSADQNALLSIPRMTPEMAAQIIDAVKNADPETDELKKVIKPYKKYITAEPTEVFRVVVEARLNNGFSKAAEAVLMAGDKTRAFRILFWRELPGSMAEPTAVAQYGGAQ